MIEIIYAVQRRKSAEREVPVGPEHWDLRPPIVRQRDSLASQGLERQRGQARCGDERHIDIAVTPAETGMGQAADEIGAKQLVPKRLLPMPDETVREIDRR